MRKRIRYYHDGSGWNALLPTGDVLAFPRSGGAFRQWAEAANVDRLAPDTLNLSNLLRWRAMQAYVRRWWQSLSAEYRSREYDVMYYDHRGRTAYYQRGFGR